jgi:hypothetical protein
MVVVGMRLTVWVRAALLAERFVVAAKVALMAVIPAGSAVVV